MFQNCRRIFSALCAIAIVIALSPYNCSAQTTRTFDGGGDGTTWSEAANWSSNNVPDTATERAEILAGFGVNIFAPITGIHSIGLYGSELEVNDSLSTANEIGVGDGSLIVNANTTAFGYIDINSSTLSLNSGVLFTPDTLYLQNTWTQGDSLVFQDGGQFDVQNLSIYGLTSMTVQSADNIGQNIDLNYGATLTVDRQLGLTGRVLVYDSTLGLNEDLLANELYLSGPATVIDRATGVTVDVNVLTLDDNANSYSFDGTDTIHQSVGVYNNASLKIDAPLSVSGAIHSGGGWWTTGGLVAINAATDAESLGAFLGSTWEINAPATASGITYAYVATMNVGADTTATGYFDIVSSTLNLNAGSLSTPDTLYLQNWLGSESQVNQNGGHFDVGGLYIDGLTTMTVGSADNISGSITVYNGADLTIQKPLNLTGSVGVYDGILTIEQSDGSTNGVSIDGQLVVDENSQLMLQFDGAASQGLDWALRCSGDVQTELQNLIANGVIASVGGTQQVSVIYEPTVYGDYTYVGYVEAAIPALSFEVTAGQYVSGDITALAVSDEIDLSVRRNDRDVQSRVFVELQSTSPQEFPSQFTFKLKASVFARSPVMQSIDLFNYATGQFEEVDSRLASTTDTVTEVDPAGDLSRFVEPGTNFIEARIRYQSEIARQQFAANIDQAIWTIR